MFRKRNAPSAETTVHQIEVDDAQLAQLGHKAQLRRRFSPWSMLGFAFAILNTWTALAASLALALPSGGPVAVIWGLITAGICNLCLAASLAEFLSAYPTSGGQYHWVAMISWKKHVPLISWITGWINVAGWIALVAAGGILTSQLIIGAIAFAHASYVPERWHQFLIYVGIILIAFLVNAFLNRSIQHVNKVAFLWTMGGFVVIFITVLACGSPNFQSGDFVYRTFINETGWPDGVAWLLGLLQAGLSLTGYDATAHMIEEIPDPTRQGPRIMIYCVAVGIFTGFLFLSALLFVIKDLTTVITSPAGPLLAIFYDATGSEAGSIVLVVFPIICLLFATTSIMTTSSRMSFAFARDGGLPFSRVFARVHPTLELPFYSLILTTVLVIIFGLIFLGSTAALNAILSSSVVALGISYAIPPAVHMMRGRRILPESRPFKLSPLVGWTANIIGVVYTLITTILFLFPPILPTTAVSMNYCIVAFGVILIISVVQWFVDGRKNFTGPKVELIAGHENGHTGQAEKLPAELNA